MPKEGNKLTYKHGQLWELACGCGTVIRQMVPDDKYERSETLNGKLVTFRHLVFACNPDYMEVAVEAGGGPGDNFITHKHVMAMCKQCAQENTLEDHQAHYENDLAEMKHPNAGTGIQVNRVLKVAPQISDI